MDWKKIYHLLDPKEPLKAADDRLSRDIYINDFYNSIKGTITLNSSRNYKLLLPGHSGCGKSTFLNLLSEDAEINKTFHVVKYSIEDILDTNDVDIVDLLLVTAQRAIVSLPEKDVEETESLIETCQRLANELRGLITVETEEETKEGGQANLMSFFSGKLFFRYKFESELREKIRTEYRTKITDFISTVNNIISAIEIHTGKKLLILVDDTDKMPFDKGLDIFFANEDHLAAIQTNIVFVVDLSVSTSSKYKVILSKLSGREFFPAIKLLEKDGKDSAATEKNMNIFTELIKKRVEGDFAAFINDDALEKAIAFSGGVVREFIRLLNNSILKARGMINIVHVEHAAVTIANEFNFIGKHTRILKNIKDDPDWLSKNDDVNEEAVGDLIHAGALFELRNGNIKWYRPNPIFNGWLDELYPG
ncbi:MAG: hypothetical protein GY754_02550 [bacterium]|nr:hypothetical protein [bacterium]